MNDQLKFYLANGEKFEQLNNLRREIIDNLSNNIKNLKFATIENGRKGQSNDKLKVYNYIDDNGGNGKIWVTIDLKEFLSKKSIEFQISCYTREINFDEIINSNDFKKSVKDNSIDIIPIKRYKWGDKILSKKYHYVADSKISVQDWIMDIYNVDWLPVIKQINLILKYVN